MRRSWSGRSVCCGEGNLVFLIAWDGVRGWFNGIGVFLYNIRWAVRDGLGDV